MATAEADSATNSGDSSGHLRRLDSDSDHFSEGDRVLVYYGSCLYEAKVQKAEVRMNEWRYFIHYLGWNKRWDEWVGVDRLVKHHEEKIMKQQALNEQEDVGMHVSLGDDVVADTKGKKQKNDSAMEETAKLIKIKIPSALKTQIVQDCHFVNSQNKLVKLPRSPTVDNILKNYLEHRSKKDGKITDEVAETLKGLRCYFDRVLPVILLYNKERQQYRQHVTNNVSPSTIYGAEHLLRLLVKLPELLPNINMEKDLAMRFQEIIVDFVKFLRKNQSAFFMYDYEE